MSDAQIHTLSLILPLEQSEDESVWLKRAARKLKVHPKRVGGIRLRKHSIDARKREIKIQLQLEVAVDGDLPEDPALKPCIRSVGTEAKRLIIVGCGPAGMFAALEALELGWQPIILERGKDAMTRRFDLAPIMRRGQVIEDSNYCFGEGGAGTFSYGKLYTRAKKRGPVRKVYETLVAHGAPERILIDAHPHVGSNLLPKVVKGIRETILASGGEVHFETKVGGLIRSADGRSIRGVTTIDGREFVGGAVVLATGHSARDIFQLL
ncbi:MAG: FAD-binding protein, partial [Verrucomicrobiota bacterium]